MSEQHEFVVNGWAHLRVRKTVKAPSQVEAKRKAKRSNKGWVVRQAPVGALVHLSESPPKSSWGNTERGSSQSTGELHEFVVNGYAYLPVSKTVKADSLDEAERKAKRSNKGWVVTGTPPVGANIDILSVLPPEGFNAAAMRRVGIDVPEPQHIPSREPVFMIPTEGKTEEQLADEIYEAVQAHWRATGELPAQQDTRRE